MLISDIVAVFVSDDFELDETTVMNSVQLHPVRMD